MSKKTRDVALNLDFLHPRVFQCTGGHFNPDCPVLLFNSHAVYTNAHSCFSHLKCKFSRGEQKNRTMAPHHHHTHTPLYSILLIDGNVWMWVWMVPVHQGSRFRVQGYFIVISRYVYVHSKIRQHFSMATWWTTCCGDSDPEQLEEELSVDFFFFFWFRSCLLTLPIGLMLMATFMTWIWSIS